MLRKVVSNPDLSPNWLALLNWGNAVLRPPKRGGKRHNLSKIIKQRISSFFDVQAVSDSANFSTKQQKRSSSTLSQAISAKLEDGNVSRAAVRLLMSGDSPAVPSLESLKALGEKHPPASSDLTDLFTPQPDRCLSVDVSEVRKAILSFPSGSAGGPDSVRPQHIRDMMLCQESGADFLSALTNFVNLVVAGHRPTDVAPVFFGGRLLALNKKTGAFAQLPSLLH